MEYKHREGGGDFLHLQLDIDIDEGGVQGKYLYISGVND